MPPRYAYWTIMVDDQPTAFRAGSQEDLMPTFKRLKDKQPTAKMQRAAIQMAGPVRRERTVRGAVSAAVEARGFGWSRVMG